MWYPILIVLLLHSARSLEDDYYWREYTGKVPEDAVIGGTDINGEAVYIGQAYVKNHGLVVAGILQGKGQVEAAMHGVKTVKSYIKILCGLQQNFVWKPTNATSLHLLLGNEHAVVGGHEDGVGTMNIGRVSHEGSVQIGKINSFNVGNSLFYFISNDKELSVDSYEVLLYKNNEFDVRIKEK